MFTKLSPVTDNTQITFNLGANDALRYLLANVNSGTQDSFRVEAGKLFDFASRLGLDDVKLATALKMPNKDRLITIERVLRKQFKIVFKADGETGIERFNGTDKELKRKLHDMRKAGKRPVRSEEEAVLAVGYKIGSASHSKANPYTFGIVWANAIEGAPQLIGRMLSTLAKYEQAVNSAKDDLLSETAKKFAVVAA